MDIRQSVVTNGGDLMARLGDLWRSQIESLRTQFGSKITEVRMPIDYPTEVPIIYISKESVVEVLTFLKTDANCDYRFLADLTATDEEVELRFEIVYNLYSPNKKARIRVKTRVAEGDSVPTVISVWPGSNWAEREVFDMFGVKFSGHPDLRRVLMDVRWEGYPLRKDYPLRGYQLFPTPEPIDPTLLEKDGVN